MRFYDDWDEALLFCKALSSEIRIEILKILTREKDINLNKLAQILGITNGALSPHIRILEEAGIIDTKVTVAKRGVQKICSVRIEKYLINIGKDFETNSISVELAPGQYVDYEVTPTCGLSTTKHVIGVYDNPIYFADLEHFNADIVWLNTGYLEYEIPNYLPEQASLSEFLFQAELGSEAVSFNNDYKSDIYFSINNHPLGVWQSPGDFGGVKGLHNPVWWAPSMNQYGTLMEIRVNKDGTFVEETKISDTTVAELEIQPKSKIRLRLAVPHGLPNSRGLTVYGRGFGNYNSGILIRMNY